MWHVLLRSNESGDNDSSSDYLFFNKQEWVFKGLS